jgi:two-component system, OmpR family, response regulator
VAFLREFRWLTANAIPPHLDLRDCGWHLLDQSLGGDEGIGIALARGMTPALWRAFLARHGRLARRLMLLIGIDDAVDRARMLRLGFGEVTGEDIALAELDARARRLAELEHTLPRYRRIGRLNLDLLAREAFVDERALGLHPREFGLLWRLADTPGRPVSKESLVKDVWRMGFVPETNSLAVHISRLRGKLNTAGLTGLVETSESGGYCLKPLEPVIAPVLVAVAPSALDKPRRAASQA